MFSNVILGDNYKDVINVCFHKLDPPKVKRFYKKSNKNRNLSLDRTEQ